MPASNYLRAAVLDHTLRASSMAGVTTAYVSLHKYDPTADALAASEIDGTTYTWYVRQACAFAAQLTSGITANANAVTFPAVTIASVTVTHFAIWTAVTGTTSMLFYGPLSASKTFNVSDVPSWLAGTLQVTAV
jgi:hypothetical protein